MLNEIWLIHTEKKLFSKLNMSHEFYIIWWIFLPSISIYLSFWILFLFSKKKTHRNTLKFWCKCKISEITWWESVQQENISFSVDSQFGWMGFLGYVFGQEVEIHWYVIEIMRLAHTFVDSLLIQIILSASFEPKSCREEMKKSDTWNSTWSV